MIHEEKGLLNGGPYFTDCFQTIIPVAVPALWLVLAGPFYIYILVRKRKSSIPISLLSLAKTILCCVLVALCFTDLFVNIHYGYRCDEYIDPPSVFYLFVLLQMSCFVFVAITTQVQRCKGLVTSWVPWIFWLLALVSEVVPLYGNIRNKPGCISSVIDYILAGVLLTQLVLYSIAESPFKKGYEHIGKEECPEIYASVVSKAAFYWFNPIVTKCFKTTMSKDDVWDQHPSLKAERIVNELQTSFDKQTQDKKQHRDFRRYSESRNGYNEIGTSKKVEMAEFSRYESDDQNEKEDQEKPSLFRCILQTYGCEWLRGCLMNIGSDCTTLAQPLVLGYIIQQVEIPKEDRLVWYCAVLAVVLFILCQLQIMFYTFSEQMMLRLGLKMKTALIGMIYRKSLRISNSVKRDYSGGEIVTLASVDCQHIQDAFQFSNQIFSFVIIMSVALYELWDPMGISFLGCIGAIVVILILNMVFGKIQQDYFEDLMSEKGSRIKIFNEVIKGIKIIKMYAWEPFFTKKIEKIRSSEIRLLKKLTRIISASLTTAQHASTLLLSPMLLIFTYVSSQPFTAWHAFRALSIVNMMKVPLQVIPMAIGGAAQAVVSLKRIQQFLWSEELDSTLVNNILESDFAIKIKNGYFKWDKDDSDMVLSGMNVKVLNGKLIAVVGPVGSGKSSLLTSILGEMETVTGLVNVTGSVSYVAQEAWIQNMTIKDNILYGKECDENKYRKVVKGCCLKPDFQILTAGDMTEIGERGVNLSGGQKQRVNLARAVYCDTDIYLLDDPLSAVDSHVGEYLFNGVIGQKGLLKNKTRILVTHGVHWLPKVDEIIVMENGKISEQGNFEDLIDHDGPFARFLKQYFAQESSDDDDPLSIQTIKDEMFDRVELVTSDGLTSEDEVGRSRRASRRESAINFKRKQSLGITKSVGKKKKDSVQEQVTPDLGSGDGKLIDEEVTEEGSVKFSVLMKFVKSMGLPCVISSLALLAVFEGLGIYSNIWLTYWTTDVYIRNSSLMSTDKYFSKKTYYLGIYGLIGILQGVSMFFCQICLTCSFVRAARIFHSRSLRCILRAPMAFFDTTPIGRIMNRFSGDIDILDVRLPNFGNFFIMMISNLLSTLIVVTMETPIILAIIAPVAILYLIFITYFLRAARQLKRIEAVSRSPVLNHFSETISGGIVIRAYKSGDRFLQEMYKRVDTNALFYFTGIVLQGWVTIRVGTFGNLVVLAAALLDIFSSTLTGAEAGLSLSYALQIIIAMNAVVQSISMLQMDIISVERVDEYTKIEPEATWTSDNLPNTPWPDKGNIEFSNYKTRYRPGLDLVLKGVNSHIKAGEKIGIAGRTGAGKSSLTMALFRLIESAEGYIKIDGINIADLGLHELRSNITILPQDPIIFTDSIRTNLDPTERFRDSEVWRAIEYAHFKDFIGHQKDLNSELGESGGNLSVGQKQLVCLARTLLHKTKILILDEATAAVDVETDSLIQQTIKSQFKDCTVLSIAHRLNTIMDYDKIMVLDGGVIAEFDTPENLLENTNSLFYSLAKETSLIYH